VFVLPNGNYVVVSSLWDDGATVDAGAVTIGNATMGAFCDGTYGPVSSSNSFVGANALSGLVGASATNIGTNSSGDSLVLVQFSELF